MSGHPSLASAEGSDRLTLPRSDIEYTPVFLEDSFFFFFFSLVRCVGIPWIEGGKSVTCVVVESRMKLFTTNLYVVMFTIKLYVVMVTTKLYVVMFPTKLYVVMLMTNLSVVMFTNKLYVVTFTTKLYVVKFTTKLYVVKKRGGSFLFNIFLGFLYGSSFSP